MKFLNMSQFLLLSLFKVKTISIHHTLAGPGQLGLYNECNRSISAETLVALKTGFPFSFRNSKTSALPFYHTGNSMCDVY